MNEGFDITKWIRDGLFGLTLGLTTMTACLAGNTGCTSALKNADGTLNMEALRELAEIAEDSGATVEIDVSLRPGSVSLVESAAWDTGIEIDARFRWTGRGEMPGTAEVTAP